ncbi:hypothetical protein [Bacillus mycoides]|uniref:hypothetical protein n=1 Tax=Bacillus mycoides TaxID=1405 RepID=UPI0012FE9239|nr:hypothetical protein [Bacillus mycoides]
MFKLYINDKFYAMGSYEYLETVVRDWIINCEMYGKEKVTFTYIYANGGRN